MTVVQGAAISSLQSVEGAANGINDEGAVIRYIRLSDHRTIANAIFSHPVKFLLSGSSVGAF